MLPMRRPIFCVTGGGVYAGGGPAEPPPAPPRPPPAFSKSAVAFYNSSYTCTVGCDDTGGGGGSTVSATFNEYASTPSGTNVYVVGSIPELGSWDTSKAIRIVPELGAKGRRYVESEADRRVAHARYRAVIHELLAA